MLSRVGPYPMVITPDEGGYWVDGEQHEAARNRDGSWQAPEIAHEHFHIEHDNTPFQYGRYLANKVCGSYCSTGIYGIVLCRAMTITTVTLKNMVHFCCQLEWTRMWLRPSTVFS